MYLISTESFRSLIRNKWQAWSRAITAKHFMLKQRCQVKGRILNTETILFLTKTWCFECIKKISKHHSLPLLKLEAVQFDGNIEIWEGWVLRLALRLLCCGMEFTTCAFCLGTSAFKIIWSCEKHSLLTRGVVMAKELRAHLRNEGLRATLDLHLTHFCNCLSGKSWAYPCPRCCPAASEPHQVCGQNQTQPIQKTAALLPLFIYTKKATAVSTLHMRILRAGALSESVKQHSFSLWNCF